MHLCAIIGGTFAAAGVIESLMRNGVSMFVVNEGDVKREVSSKKMGEAGVQMVPQDDVR